MRLVEFGDRPTFDLLEVDDPVPGPGQVVVKVVTAALNRRDPWIWTTPGYCALPVTLGSDGAGIVSAVGEGVRDMRPGDEVVVNPTLNWTRGCEVPGPAFDILGAPTDGTFAEQVLVPASNLAPRPARLTWEESGALPLAGLTAWRALFVCAGATSGNRVLITGASGGVSSFLVQLAAAAGARVVATTSSSDKRDRAIELGASAAVLHTEPDWPKAVIEAAGGPLDAVVDSYGGPSWSAALPLLRWGGIFVTFGDTGGATATIEISDVYWNWRSIVGTSMGSPEDFQALLDHVAMAAWRPLVDSVFPLEELSLAADRLAAGDRYGKVVIRVSEAPSASRGLDGVSKLAL
jgi:NADPH:quinone reductase-like Zn-dependent oxidoreductase